MTEFDTHYTYGNKAYIYRCAGNDAQDAQNTAKDFFMSDKLFRISDTIQTDVQ